MVDHIDTASMSAPIPNQKHSLPKETTQYLHQVLQRYQDSLMRDIIPFWMHHGADLTRGGVTNCLDERGQVISTEKYIWSQGRFLWTLSALLNWVERRPEWLELATRTASFLLKHGREKSGAWRYSVTQDGLPSKGPCSLYADAFAILGLTEYARATGDSVAAQAGLEGFARICSLLKNHALVPTTPHQIPLGFQAHGPSMIFALVFYELGTLTGESRVMRKAVELAETVVNQHLKVKDRVLYEFVRAGGGINTSGPGGTVIAGHAIESSWILERIFAGAGKEEHIPVLMESILWHLERGWDQEFGGILLAQHISGGEPSWHQPDAKVWWPHTEAIYALLRAYAVTRDERFLEWHKRVDDYTWRVFPDRVNGEWKQNRDRQGNPVPVVAKALPVKDPFHLPRTLIYSMLTLRQLITAPDIASGR